MEDTNEKLNEVHTIMCQIPIADIMTQPVTTIHLEDDFSLVEEIFVSKKLRHLPVVDDNQKIVGLISQRDVYRRIAPRRRPDGEMVYQKGLLVDEDGYYEKQSLNRYILKYLMHKEPKVLTADKTLSDVIDIMVAYKPGCVPIVDTHNKVIGIVTRFDILRLISKDSET